jgi:hypothetical protein
MKSSGSKPSWTDVKSKLAAFDRAGLIGLVHDLYATSKDNQAFLHARFALGGDVLKPYKATIDRWLWPDVFKNQDTSVAKAKKAISDYTKAVGQTEGLGGTHGVLLRAGGRLQQRRGYAGRSLVRRAVADVRAGP